MNEAVDADARMGPNAIIQVGTALQGMLGTGATRGLFDSAGLTSYLDLPPKGMVAEREVIQLHTVLRQTLAGPLMQRVTHDAGTGTGDYLLRHRIPRAAQGLLRLMPRRMASRLLVAAIMRHSWTFEGSGRLSAVIGPPPVFILERCALCRDARAAAPLCGYYAATFERLFQQLIEPTATVTETDCAAVGGNICRFEVHWN